MEAIRSIWWMVSLVCLFRVFPLLAAAFFWYDIQEVSANCDGFSYPHTFLSVNDGCRQNDR